MKTSFNLIWRNRFITIIAFFISMMGFYAEFFIPKPWTRLFSCMHLSFFEIERHFDGVLNMNILNVIFYIYMLLGTLLYVFSKFKETRLIRLSFSMIILSRVLYFIAIVFFIQVESSYFGEKSLLFLFFCFISLFVYGILSFICLKWLNMTKKIEKNKRIGTDEFIYAEVPLSIRFCHHLIDLFLCVILFFPLINGAPFFYLTQKFSLQYEKEWVTLYFLLAIFLSRFLYYMLFESIYKATPAKFLTESIVAKKESSLTLKTTMLRTLIRFVPFEPFSFLWSGCWHDRWTSTLVIEEKRTGVSLKKYWLVIPLFFLVILFLWVLFLFI